MGSQVGPDGVLQIYPTASGGTEVYMKDNPDSKIFNVSYGHNSHIKYSKKTQGSLTFFNTEGSPISYRSGNKSGRSTRIDTYPGGGMWSNKTNYSWKDNPGYLYNEQGIANGEYTTFIRVHGDLGTHQAYAHKIGGRDEDNLRSLMEMVYPTSSHSAITINYNFAHFPYVSAKPKIIKSVKQLKPEQWIGVKTIHIVAADKKSTHWEMWVNEDPFAADGTIQNNWVKAAEYEDKGCSAYGNKPVTWKCHKDVCRVDGFSNVDFALFSDREIDASGGGGGDGNPVNNNTGGASVNTKGKVVIDMINDLSGVTSQTGPQEGTPTFDDDDSEEDADIANVVKDVDKLKKDQAAKPGKTKPANEAAKSALVATH